MHRFAHSSRGIVLAVSGIALAMALTACTPTPEQSSTSTPVATPSAPFSGPVVFIGDELDSFALTPEEITGLIPGASGVGPISSSLTQVSDGGGAQPVPAICEIFYAEQSLGSVGSREVEWKTPADPEYGFGRMSVLQFADEAQAQARMDDLMQAAQQCGTFEKEGAVTFESFIAPESGDVRAFAGTLLDVDSGYDWRSFSAFAATGNVLVQLWQPFTGDQVFDAEAAATLLAERADEARSGLIDDLTANPPAAVEDASADGATWGRWRIGTGGVGSVRLGDAVDVAVAAAGGVSAPPEYERGPWTITNAEGSGSLLVQPVEGADTVAAITVGDDRSLAGSAQDGAALPAWGAVRIGSAVADAVAAAPGGTSVTVVSSGDYYYQVATREGIVFRFIADADPLAAGSTIRGIAVEDATTRGPLVFG